ncbi:glycogen debranching enzyme Gdb1 [Aspergillus luchuensis]|uniref:Glycogen debranching enzyme Gdb1 n=1 Tax=Aspergillus kawachii TaxID=1069201 RepID=A0A146FLC0_ASPKA|nr:glycogen debranching enzyme Gdb1 [Aspergillus luchuensis]
MKRAVAVITDHNSHTSQAAIVSYEIGVPVIVGTHDATNVLHSGQDMAVSCS